MVSSIVQPASTEDKIAWCRTGEEYELEFCRKYGDRIGIRMNPEKEENPYAPDLMDADGYADLKFQGTPFYRSGTHGLNPLQCVVLNRKDATRYYQQYPNITIYFWLNFKGGTAYGTSVPRLEAIYSAKLEEITRLIQGGYVPLHHYQKRGDNKENAKCSYLLDTSVLRQLLP